ncbi:MAG: hypothetical protein IJP86_03735 [Synergistaceae bacterium]|nr:hypothetical protein [Synergistaceae bacterium]
MAGKQYRDDIIHPRSLLERAGIDQSRINSIGNLQFLDPDANRKRKRAKEFGDWLKSEICEENPYYTYYLKKHLIPKDSSLWHVRKFDEFLRARLRIIAYKIKSEL